MTDQPAKDIPLRRARPTDVPAIKRLVEPYVEQKILLPRTDAEIAHLATNGFVARVGRRIVGFAAIEIYSRKLAELQCLAVADDFQGRGIGKRLVRACVELAHEKKVVELMAITASERLFNDCGFHHALPGQKKAVFINP